jgi:hypothetical protein
LRCWSTSSCGQMIKNILPTSHDYKKIRSLRTQMTKLILNVNECLYDKEKTTSLLTSNTLIPFRVPTAIVNYTATVMKENRIFRKNQ